MLCTFICSHVSPGMCSTFASWDHYALFLFSKQGGLESPCPLLYTQGWVWKRCWCNPVSAVCSLVHLGTAPPTPPCCSGSPCFPCPVTQPIVGLFSWAPKSLQMVTAAMKLKDTYSLVIKSYDKPRQSIKKKRHYFADKNPYSSLVAQTIQNPPAMPET